ncbi:hypothetical protein [Mycobacterium sp.]|uniref:hypothetical protein n=1 Tax=Mycobacterium sp. TaxID=1785 RepID=UPI003CBC97E2
MAGRNSANKQSRNGTARRCGVVMGGALGAFVAAAAMATGSAAPAKADFEELLDPIIQPLLMSVTDSLAGFDPAAATDITSWTDSLLSSLNSIDLAVPSAVEPATALPASDLTPPATAYIPLTMQETTEPTVNASIDGSTDQLLLVDTGSSGLVIPISDLDSGSNEFAELLSLGLPSSFGESGYSGGVDYIYLTYNALPVDYDLGGVSTLDTTAPVEVEVYSWDPSDPTSFFTNDAFQTFLTGNDSPGGILGIGDNVSGGAGESPIEAAGYNGVTVDEPDGYLIASDSNPGTALPNTEPLTSTGSTVSGLTETVTDPSTSTVVGTGTVSDDLDSGGVYGTIPSSIESNANGVPDGDYVNVYDGNTLLYSYQVENAGGDQLPNETPTEVSGSSIDSGYQAFEYNPVYIDYDNGDLYYDDTLS